MIQIRKGQAPAPLDRAQFNARFRASFIDAAFQTEEPSIARLEEIAWQAYSERRKAPIAQWAGPGCADPDSQRSTEWAATKQRLADAQDRWAEPTSTGGNKPGRARVLEMAGWNYPQHLADRLQVVQPSRSRPRQK